MNLASCIERLNNRVCNRIALTLEENETRTRMRR